MPAGTIALTNGSATVTGTGTSFTTEFKVGDFLGVIVGGVPYTLIVSAIASDTSLTIVANFTGPTASGLAWNAVPATLQTAITQQAMNDMSKVLRGMIQEKANWQQVYSGTGTITVKLPDGSTYSGPAWNSITTAIAAKADLTDGAVSLSQGGTGSKTKAGAATNLGLGTTDTPTFSGIGIKSSAPSFNFYFNNSSSITSRFVQYDSSNLALLGANFRAPKYLIGDGANGTMEFTADSTLSTITLTGAPVLFKNGIAGAGANGVKVNNYWNMLYNGTLNWFINNANVGYVSVTTSDRTRKKDISYDIDYVEDLKKVMAIKPASFVWDDGREDKSTKRGFIAQDLYEVADDMALKPLDIWGVEMLPLLSRMVGAVKAQQGIIESQAAEINELKARMKAIDGLDQ
ncbi:tail fiber domain-containing protein [Kalamiella sp. sgz302252]|uniref:tail fiber domain-containing protein n=1 Tax=Pantoea sp. sgz302252 TaxID=3341827 RepID=UPI0036D3E2C5